MSYGYDWEAEDYGICAFLFSIVAAVAIGITCLSYSSCAKSGTVKIKPEVARDVLSQYTAFIQSTSANRKLIGGTRFLYEVSDWERS